MREVAESKKSEIFLKIEIDFSCQLGIAHPPANCFALQPFHCRFRKQVRLHAFYLS